MGSNKKEILQFWSLSDWHPVFDSCKFRLVYRNLKNPIDRNFIQVIVILMLPLLQYWNVEETAEDFFIPEVKCRIPCISRILLANGLLCHLLFYLGL